MSKNFNLNNNTSKKILFSKFKKDYKRISLECNKDNIKASEWDKHKPFLTAKTLKAYTKLTFKQLAIKAGIKEPYIKKPIANKLDDNLILQMRLDYKSLGEIASIYNTSNMTIHRRLKKIYAEATEDIRVKLDTVAAQLYCNKKL